MNYFSIVAILSLLSANFAYSKFITGSGEEFDAGEFQLRTGDDEDADQIVGGQVVDAKVHSYMAAIYDTAIKRFICTGTLYKSRYILTAGHCVAGKAPRDIGVYLNTTTLRGPEPGFIARYPAKITVAPEYVYSDTAIQNDLAVIDMGLGAVESLSRLTSVKFAQVFPEPTYAGAIGSILGWGATASGSTVMSNYLLRTSVRIMDNPSCQSMLVNLQLGSGIMCTWNSAQGSACYGDDGGPIMYAGFQVGIAIKTPNPCGESPVPSLYMRIGSSYQWIAANTP